MGTHHLQLKPATARTRWFVFMADGSWERKLVGNTFLFLGYYAPVLDPGSQRLVPPVPDLLNPQGWMNIEFDCAVPPTASPSLGEEQSHTLPMFSVSPVTNVFPKKSLFPFPFTFPLQLAMCHNREKQHRQQHRACDKSLQKQRSPEMPVSSAVSRQRQQGRQALR